MAADLFWIPCQSASTLSSDGQGLAAENTAWVSRDDGLLVRDLDGDGQITTGRELFGNNTVLTGGRKASNGFEALAELDDNGDGVVDNKDAAFASLKVWRDANSNGVTNDGELLSLHQAMVRDDSGQLAAFAKSCNGLVPIFRTVR